MQSNQHLGKKASKAEIFTFLDQLGDIEKKFLGTDLPCDMIQSAKQLKSIKNNLTTTPHPCLTILHFS